MSDVDMAKSDHKPGPAVTGDGDYMDYREAKRLAGDADTGVRVRLAQRDDVQPEVLYFLAEDDAPEVRRAIAANDTTPRQADQILVEDVDDEVRLTEQPSQGVPRVLKPNEALHEFTYTVVEISYQTGDGNP